MRPIIGQRHNQCTSIHISYRFSISPCRKCGDSARTTAIALHERLLITLLLILFYLEYDNVDPDTNLTTCLNGEQAGQGKVCKFNVDDISTECNKGNNFGYSNGTPCVLLKVNKVKDILNIFHNHCHYHNHFKWNGECCLSIFLFCAFYQSIMKVATLVMTIS